MDQMKMDLRQNKKNDLILKRRYLDGIQPLNQFVFKEVQVQS
jgi:hypothetical protein